MEQLLELKEAHREMVRMEMEGKRRKEIGEALGYDEQTVGRLLLHDELIEGYRQEVVKEKERILKRGRVRAELRLKGYIEDFVETIHDIAMGGRDHSTRLNACVKGLQFAGMKLTGEEPGMTKAPRIVIRDSDERIEKDGVTKPSEEVDDEIRYK